MAPRRSKSKGKKKSQTQSARAGVTFPVGRLGRLLRTGKYSPNVGAGAPVYLASALEYLCVDIL